MTELDDKGIVYSAGSPYSQFSTVIPAVVGDKVILIEIGSGQRIAVPALSFDIGQYSWVIPDFKFAGFNWNLDFNFQLLGLKIGAAGLSNHDFSCYSGILGQTFYGDGGQCEIVDGSGWAESADEREVDRGYLFEDNYTPPPDVYIDVKMISPTMIRVWFGSNPDKPYSGSQDSLYYKGTLLATAVWEEPGNLYDHWTIHEDSVLLNR